MSPWKIGASRLATVAVFCFVFAVQLRAASDVVTVGTVEVYGSTVNVPVYIRDVSGTPLGMDQPAGSKIQSFSIKVNYSPAASVQSATFNRAGITASLTPTSEFKPSSAGSVSLLATFQESNNLIPFNLNASAPGNEVALLSLTLASSVAPGSTITLTLDSSLTQLTDSGGTAATKETVANGALVLVDGEITVPPVSVSLSPGSRTITVGDTRNLSAVLSSVVGTDTNIALSSNKPNIASVPAFVVVPAGSSSASVPVTAVAVGNATITANLNESSFTSNITVEAEVPQCPKPSAPQLTAPASVGIGTTYAVSWNAVANVSEYQIEESSNADFSGSTLQTVTGTSASFSHTSAEVRFYYRVRARNRAGTCDVFSDYSATTSVLITAAPVPLSRVLVVVGSQPGNFGSFFRTSVQLYNPYSETVAGKLVFHAAGTIGSPTDTSLSYSVAPGKTLAFSDLLPAMGLGGLGSVDMIASETSQLPIALARVFNDGGAAGTTGLAEEALSSQDALAAGSSGVLFAPPDMTKFRLNVGVRTLEQGATVTITVRDKDGLIVKTRSRGYSQSFFEQVGSAGLLEGYALAGGETITFEVTSGSLFVYGAVTDNKTNDPSVQFARRIQ